MILRFGHQELIKLFGRGGFNEHSMSDSVFYTTALATQGSDERISYNGHEQISKYIWMPHYVPNEYPNIFGCNIFTERISEFIHIPEIAKHEYEYYSRVILFKYSNILTHH